MRYAKIENGQVVKVVSKLPENFENTSGFAWLPAAELAARGWLPIVDVTPALGPLESYGPDPLVTIHADHVTREYVVVAASLANAKQHMRREIRDQLKAQLYRDFDADDYVAMLVMQVTPAAVKTRVTDIKAAYDTAIAAVNAATTVADALAVTAAWPA